MNTLKFNLKDCGKIRIMHAVNNAPKAPGKTQSIGNFESYKALNIPYARYHDTMLWRAAGGPNVVDISSIFKDFSKDENDPASYDFFYTDKYVQTTFAAGTKPFFRLGESIEHGEKKYNVHPPQDFNKWARICEHIISHYTEGWADGFNYDMEYWEIWGEPDCKDKSLWTGTQQEFFDLYEITAKHLKSRFPHLKIGGPGLSQTAFSDITWGGEFLEYMSAQNVPIDFFSWHIYADNTDEFIKMSNGVQELLDKNGYTQTENIMNEWNYVKDWTDNFTYSIKQIIGVKGAAFEAAVMCTAQLKTTVDMAMYYDARPSGFNGIFDFYTMEPLKGYYPIKMFSELYALGTQVECLNDMKDIYALGAMNDKGESGFMIARYEDDDSVTEDKKVTVKIPELKNKKFECSVVDDVHTNKIDTVKTDADGNLELIMKPNCVFFLKTM